MLILSKEGRHLGLPLPVGVSNIEMRKKICEKKPASPCFHTLLQPYLTGIMGDNEYYKGQPSGRYKTIQEVSTG